MKYLCRQLLAGCFAAVLLFLPAGCEVKPGVVFPPPAKPLLWPPPPEAARIIYVGKLETSADLKPGANGLEALGQALFGKESVRSMLTPMAVCTDGANRVFVADSNAQAVHVFDMTSRQYALWKPAKNQPPLAQPVGLAWDGANQRLLVSDSVGGCLFVFDAGGRCTGTLGQDHLKRPVGIAVDSRPNLPQRILVADAGTHQIVVLASDGKLLQRVGTRGDAPGQFNFPTYLAFAPNGLFYVSDSLNHRIQQFDADFKPLRQIGGVGDVPGSFAEPKGISTDSEGHLYVVDCRFENVQIFDSEGHILLDFGEEGIAPGQFSLPTTIFIDPHDRLWIADSYNRRLQVFDYKKVQETQP